MENTSITSQPGILESILQASPIVQGTLLILIAMSIITWAIIFFKKNEFKKIKKHNSEFDQLFDSGSSMNELYEEVDNYKHSTLAKVYNSAYEHIKNSSKSGSLETASLERVLRKASEREIESLESKLTFLATTGSTGPFIGLFGTVWGIMGSFQKIGETGMASLAVVAPGISEALVATAVGLAAAIPATIAYNHFVNKLRLEENTLNHFSGDILNLINSFKGEES